MIKYTKVDRVFLFIIYLFLTFCFLVVLYPLVFVVSSSFSDPAAVAAGNVKLWPVNPTLKAYKMVFGFRSIKTGFKNSFIYYMISIR
jgi:multiple sugar transport system permease protein/putative aldouronate transport system permease protein